MNRPLKQNRAGVIAALAVLLLGGCGDLLLASKTQRYQKASVVEYLYPDTKEPVPAQGVPVLNLPMRVGLAFVPTDTRNDVRTESRQTELLEKVATRFRSLDYVKAIEVIPSAYLTPRGGFENLEQLRAIYGVDTIALVSYDQKQFTDQGLASLSYWTIVGLYVVPGEKNSTHTMVDTVVMHIPSRKMLFRAPGVSQVKGLATPVNQSEQLRADGAQGFDEAVEKMIGNLQTQLVAFQERVKSSPEEYQVVRADGSGARGGGDFGPWAGGLFALLIAGGAWWNSRR